VSVIIVLAVGSSMRSDYSVLRASGNEKGRTKPTTDDVAIESLA
jgi:hypothetical protein